MCKTTDEQQPSLAEGSEVMPSVSLQERHEDEGTVGPRPAAADVQLQGQQLAAVQVRDHRILCVGVHLIYSEAEGFKDFSFSQSNS